MDGSVPEWVKEGKYLTIIHGNDTMFKSWAKFLYGNDDYITFIKNLREKHCLTLHGAKLVADYMVWNMLCIIYTKGPRNVRDDFSTTNKEQLP